MSDWQSIESAPKDGTFVLLHNPDWPNDVEGFGTGRATPGPRMFGFEISKTGSSAPSLRPTGSR